MNSSPLSMRDLEYLIAVAETKNFGKAAQLCHVSQPGLSAQVKKIEELLDVRIFERTKRHFSITPIGQAIIEQAARTLEEARKLFQIASPNRVPLSGNLTLGSVHTVGPYLIPFILAQLRQEYKTLELNLKEGMASSLLSDLKSGKVDALLMPSIDDDSLIELPLYFEPFGILFPSNHPLLKRTELRPRDLNPAGMILLEEGNCLRNDILNLCPSYQKNVNGAQHATSIETLKHLVASGTRYTLLPQLALAPDPRLDALTTTRYFSHKHFGRTIVLAFRKQYFLSKDMHILAKQIRATLGKNRELNNRIFVEKEPQSTSISLIKMKEAVNKIASISKAFDWVGVYLLEGGILKLGPYKGPPTKYSEIPIGKGVCGTAVKENKDFTVQNVREVDNYLACSYKTQSELVVLIRNLSGKVVGLIDVDSSKLNAFSSAHEREIRQIAKNLGSIEGAV